jgi:superfamily II DNA or RNA helicase
MLLTLNIQKNIILQKIQGSRSKINNFDVLFPKAFNLLTKNSKYFDIINNNGYCIGLNRVTEDMKAKIINDLTVEPEKYIGKSEQYKIYFKSPNGYDICLPRYYGIKNFASDNIKNVVNLLSLGKNESNFKITYPNFLLKDIQKKAYIEILKSLNKYSTCTTVLGCGIGKTVLAIYLIQQLHLNAIVIVHRLSLLKQWQNEIQKYTNAKIGLLHRKNEDYKNADITITTIKNILLRKNCDLYYKNFAIAIFDESHHLNAQEFHKVLRKVNTRYMIGLTATPNKCEQLHINHVFKQFLSPVIIIKDPDGQNENINGRLENTDDFQIGNLREDNGCFNNKENDNWKIESERINEMNNGNKVIAKIILYKKLFTKHINLDYGGQKKPNVSRMLSNISENIERSDYILSIIMEELKNKEKNILVISDRLKQLKYLSSKLLLKNVSCGLFIGGMKIQELEESKTKRVILGSYGVCEEGLNILKLNVLIFGTPRPNIEQSIGRLRINHKKIKEPIIIYDIVDYFSGTFIGQYTKRRNYYKKNYFITEKITIL